MSAGSAGRSGGSQRGGGRRTRGEGSVRWRKGGRGGCVLVLAGTERRPGPRDEALDAQVRGAARAALDTGAFRGEAGELSRQVLPGEGGGRCLVLAGLGPEGRWSAESVRRLFGAIAREARRRPPSDAVLRLDGQVPRALLEALGPEAAVRAMVEGWRLGGYRYQEQKSSREAAPAGWGLALDAGDLGAEAARAAREGLRAGEAMAAGVLLARDLANAPANELYPQTLASRARSVARARDLRCRVLGPAELRRRGMGAILGVAQGSDRTPRLIELEYRPPDRSAPTLVFVGKAVTFDSGGISIKPARGMEDMKYDMAGGAAVIGAMQTIAELRPPVRVVGLVPSSENLLGGSAYRPGDVLVTAAGKTVEVVNTDAEGRLLLADGLHHALSFRPDAVVDIATLTGSVVMALGTRVTGFFSNAPELAGRVREAATRSGERVWELPIFDEAREAMKSRVADLRNAGPREAGAITAAAFLEAFVGDADWAHLDIGGTGWTGRTRGHEPAGATGAGARLLAQLVLDFAGGRRRRRRGRKA